MPKLFHVASLYGPALLSSDAVIDQGLVTEVMSTVVSVVGTLFTTFPLNVFVILSIASAGIALFRKGKKAAR